MQIATKNTVTFRTNVMKEKVMYKMNIMVVFSFLVSNVQFLLHE